MDSDNTGQSTPIDARRSQEVSRVIDLLGNNKVVFIEGPVKSGKTSLAIAALNTLRSQRGPNEIRTFFTTPAVQEIIGAMSTHDDTGVSYQKLPPLDDLSKFDGDSYIVIDEVSSRGPDPYGAGNWRDYINLPGTKFLVLMHPGRSANQDWQSLFQEIPSSVYTIT